MLERNLKQQVLRERRTLEGGLAVLASVGSTAPFVGLFGTVWGIMSAMKDISRIGNASIDVVAGPIGEALVATGIGIAVAIPAVLAFNFFVRRVKSVTADLDDFANDFLNLAQHAVLRVERRPQEVHRLQPASESRGAIEMAVSTSEDNDVLSEINITPLVDVMLVLLVAFVITIPALTNAIHINLPRTVQTTPPEQQKAITVTVDTTGAVYFDDVLVRHGGNRAAPEQHQGHHCRSVAASAR